MKAPRPRCYDTRPCFAKQLGPGTVWKCAALTIAYNEDGACPFCKPDRDKRAPRKPKQEGDSLWTGD